MDNNSMIREMLEKNVWAVVGATPNCEKISNQIFNMLSRRGYEVYAVNPNYDEIEPGVKCYHSIEELPKIPQVIDYVVPPAVTLASLQKIDPEIIKHVWFQPGTYNAEVIKFAEEKGFCSIKDGCCVMVELRSF